MAQRTILVVEDNALNRAFLKNILISTYDVVEADNGKTAMDILSRMDRSFSAILLDLGMPVMDGYQVLEELRKSAQLSQIPVIVTTGSDDESSQIRALGLGATDYILKPYKPEIICRRVENLVRLRESALLINTLQRDKLTGLYNREAFFDEVERLTAEKPAGYYTVSAVDIQKFRLINDRYGAAKGDEVLKRVGSAFEGAMWGSGGICCRVAADNFAMLFPTDILETIDFERAHIAATAGDDELPPLTFSIGRCRVDDLSLSASSMYDRAKLAKATVKGRYDVHIADFDDAMLETELREQQIAEAMKAALDDGQFEAWFQPQYNNFTGALIGAEALARWRSPERGLIPPGAFIPVFEKNGFVYELDKYIWEQTCRVLRRCIDEGRRALPVSVNLSRYDVFRADLFQVLTGLLEKYALPTELLRLEITESAFASDADRLVEVVTALVDYGFTVEIDDFGSGFSSLNTLKDVPAQIIKLDMRFLEGQNNLERGGSIIESIVRMSRWLGIAVIAEGVETMAHASYLKSIGCHYSQGYYFARPMPEADYMKRLDEGAAEQELTTVSTVTSLDNSAFWDPNSMDTLIFNSYVGSACIFEYHRGNIELMRLSARYSQLFGRNFTVEMAQKLDWASFITAEEGRRLSEAIALSAETREDVTLEVVLAKLPGDMKPIYERFHIRVIATSGERYLVYATFENITREHEAELEAATNLARMQTVMDSMPVGVSLAVLGEADVKYLSRNDKYYSLLGLAHSEQEAPGLVDCAFPEDRKLILGESRAALRSGGSCSVEYRITRPDGAVRWMRSVITAISYPGHEGPVMLSASSDITERDSAQRELLDNLPSGAGVYELNNGQLSLIYQNRSFWHMVGLGNASFPETGAMSAIHPEDAPMLMQELSAAMGQGRNVSCEVRLKHLTEGYHRVHLAARIVPQEAGSFMIYVTYTPADSEAEVLRRHLPLLLKTLLSSEEDFAFAKDKDFRYLCCTESFPAVTGCGSVANVIGKTDFELFPRDEAEQTRQSDLELLESGEPLISREKTWIAADGMEHYHITSKYLLRDSDGEVAAIYGVGRDETVQQAYASHMKLLTDELPGGIISLIMSPGRTALSYMNEGAIELTGFTEEELRAEIEEGGSCGIEDDYLPLVRAQFTSLMQDGTPAYCIIRLRDRNGDSSKWACIRAVLSERHGEHCYINALLTDVTERQEMIEQLRASEEQFRVAADFSGLVLGRYDIRTDTFHHNDRALISLGLPLEIKDPPQAFIDSGSVAPESEEALRDLYARIRRGGDTCRAEARLKLLDGQLHWCRIDASIIHDSDGRPAQAIVVTTDIEQQREKELVYKRWQLSLENKAPEDYTLFRCNLSKNGVCDTVVGELEGKAAELEGKAFFHERTINYARSSVHPEDKKAYLQLMNTDALLASYYRGNRMQTLEYRRLREDGSERWTRLTVELVEYPNSTDVGAYLMYEDIDESKRDELLMLQRAETDPLTGLLNRKTFESSIAQRIDSLKAGSLSALLIVDLDGFKQVNDTFGHAVGDETLIEIAMKLRESFRDEDLLCRLGGDEYLIYLQNIPHISAIKERAALVCALLHKSFSLDVQLSASVGVAVCPTDGRDFETLYRKADAALYQVKESGKDSYILYDEGMSPSYREGKGEGDETPNARAALRRAAPRRRMLIAEDNEINRDYLGNLFADDFIIETAAEGTAALVRLKRYGAGISIVLLDLNMPGMDGFEVLRRMQDSPVTQAIPVIVVSGLDEHENCLKAIRAGAYDYVTKPIDAELLTLRVSSALSRADNEQLRAQNRFLAMQNEEARRLAEAKRHSEELSTALHAAERADIAKTQFLSSMSHEIRTPLNALIGYNAMAKGELATAAPGPESGQLVMRVMDCLTKTEIASRQLLNIVNDVLDISAIESGKLRVEDSPFDFRGLITSLTVMFFSQARAKGVNFDVIFDRPTEEWFRGDQMRVNQILTNLLSNAVKFTPEGGNVTLAITQTESDEDSAGFCFVVKDSGIGMTQEYLTHIWTPFEQAEASIARRFGGSGLGLSITKNLVDLMGGSIEVQSGSGVGSTFTVRLRFGRTEQPAKQTGSDYSHINALVVDDDGSTCDYIKLLFDRCGADCTTFRSGREAVDAFAEALYSDRPYTLCLVDWKMPQMDGFSTITEIRRIAGKKLPIVVVTGYDFSEVADQAETLGVNRFISKPLFQSSLFDLLSNISGGPTERDSRKSEKHDFDGARILLVEDNNMNMEVAKHILSSANFAIDCAWNGQEAIDIFKASKPGVYAAVLMDVHMPVIDGYQATRKIRAMNHPDAATVPIIAMTADVFAEDIAEARSAGMNGHIAKPIDVEALFRLLSDYAEDIKA